MVILYKDYRAMVVVILQAPMLHGQVPADASSSHADAVASRPRALLDQDSTAKAAMGC